MVTEKRKRALAMFTDNQSGPPTALSMEAERMKAMRAKSEKLKALRLEKAADAGSGARKKA